MQEQQIKQREKQHLKLQQNIKKDIVFQDIENLRISYSYLDKKSNSGITSNTRLFFLYHKDKVGYINELPKGQMLPFKISAALPKLKASIELDKIEEVNNIKEILKIVFNKAGKKEVWEFKCSNVQLSTRWNKIINTSRQQVKDDRLNPPRDIVVQQKQEQKKESSPIAQDAKNLKSMENQIRNSAQSKSKDGPLLEKENLPQSPKKEGNRDDENIMKQANQQKQKSPSQAGNDLPVFGKGIQQKLAISKPQSSLFVGSMAVDNEKDQKELKSKMQSFDLVASKVRQEYEKRKQQEKKIQEQIKFQSPESSILKMGKDLLTFSTNTKYQIEKMQRQWGYQFSKSQNQYEIVEKFKYYVEAVSKKIIDELGLQQKKRYYQPHNTTSTTLQYEINGVIFQVYLTQLKEINSNAYSFADKGTTISNEQAKLAAHEFKNYEYVLRLTENKGKIRVPLSMITKYKGLTVYAKVMIPSTQGYDNMDLLEKELQMLQAQSRINNSIFQDPQPHATRIVALQSKAYQKLARSQNLTKKFDLCFIQGLKHYLPQDFNNFSKEKGKQRGYERLRWELIQDDECEDLILHGEDMCSVTKRLKLPQHLRDGINQLTNISKLVLERVGFLAEQLESTNEYFTNSEELSEIMHRHGINMRYLGALLEKVRQNWLKQIIMSQICARCAKKYLNFDLQDCLLNLSQSNLQNVQKFQVKQVINFLNKIFGNSQETETFWKQLNRQSQSEYGISINTQQINQPYLLQALQHQCGIKLANLQFNKAHSNGNEATKSNVSGLQKTGSKLGLAGSTNSLSLSTISNANQSKINVSLFSISNPFTIQNFASFEFKFKVYDLGFTQLYNSIKSIISNHTDQSYEQLKLLLNIARTQSIPSHFRMSQMYKDIVLFLITWISPKEMQSIYESQEIELGEKLPSKMLYEIKLTQIRWALKENRVEESQTIKDWLVDHVNRWIGDCHPILTELYQIYANYYMMFKDQQKKAVNYCKSAIKNQEKLIGLNHQKMADNYYLLGTVYRNYGKKTQAINSLKKAKEIIIKNHGEQSNPYGEVCLKMGQLYLAVNEPDQARQSGLEAMKILEKCINPQSEVQAIELVCRCYQIQQDWESYFNLIQKTLANRVAAFVDDLELTEKVIKACILPTLIRIANSSVVTQKILKIISELPETTRAPNMAYNFLKLRIEEKMFPHRFLEALDDIQDVLEEIQTNGMLTRWKGFQSLSNKSLLNKIGVNMQNRGFNFIATLQALNIFLGSSFIEGILLDH